ncbi:matrixin family metalloprotease [Bdellovibrio svalbardensis]|uniref:Matrixin family metalloprotease n=1 Tax=Bdellovibrio svalbardensis TaxID=2972972 RepID=A0ABT6DNX4_9BACT|nr:matrixin family metalloprotease [Bdellovibrio svalbardensis]MDG0817790.1 matrixin family metalloprotease [Bdellovibrio svalbardensis]
MWKWTGAALLLSVALFVQACAPKAAETDCGFVQNSYGERVSWKNEGIIDLYIHDSFPNEYIPALQSAALTWERSAGRRLFNIITEKVGGEIAPHKDGKNVIYFMNTWEANRSTEQARTSIYWNGDQIAEADIRVNALNFGFYWKDSGGFNPNVNIEALLLHELGHVLGLKHKDSGGSVMATYLPSGANRIQLASTDVSDLKCEY